MWPKCRGRRLPVKLTGVPATAASSATTAGGGNDTSGGNTPLPLVVDCSQAVAAVPPTTTSVQSDSKTCGCSRKPCWCLPDSESASASTRPTQEKPKDLLRPATYEPREALFRMRGGRKVRLTPIPASGSKGEPKGGIEQTRLLPRSQHRRLILKDTAAEVKDTANSDRHPERLGDQQNPLFLFLPSAKATGLLHQTPARAGTYNEVEETANADRCPERLGSQQHLLFLLVPNAKATGPVHQTPARAGTHNTVEEAANADRRPERLGGQQHLLFLLLPSAFPLRYGPLFELLVKPGTVHLAKKDLWHEDNYPGPFREKQEQMSVRPEMPIQGTSAPAQATLFDNQHAMILDDQQEPSSSSRLATFNRDIHIPMQKVPVGDCRPVRFSCKQEPLSSRLEPLIQSTNAPTQETPLDVHHAVTLNGQQGPLSSRLAMSDRVIWVPKQEIAHDDCSPQRLSSEQESLSSRPGTPKHGVHIPIQEAAHSDHSPEGYSRQLRSLSSALGASKSGIHIPIQEVPRRDCSLDRLISQSEPLSSRPGTSRYGIQIPIHEATRSDYSPGRLSGNQELLFSRSQTSKRGVHIPIQEAPHSGYRPETLSSQQEPLSSRPVTLKYGIQIPIQEASYCGRSPERLCSQRELLSSGSSKLGIHIPIQEIPHSGHNSERINSKQEPLSSTLGTSKSGIRIPIQEEHHSDCNPERLSSQQEPLSSRSETSKYGIHIPVYDVLVNDSSSERFRGQTKLLSSRPGTSKCGTHILIREASYYVCSPERLSAQQGFSSQQEAQSSRPENSKYSIHIPIQEAPCSDYSPETLSSQQKLVSSRPGTFTYGIHIPVQEAPCDDHHPERLIGQQEMPISRLEASKYGIHIPTQFVSRDDYHLGTGKQEHMIVGSEEPAQKIHLLRQETPHQVHGPVHISDKQTQVPEEPETNVQDILPTKEEEQLQHNRSWIFGFLLNRVFGRPKPSIQDIPPTTDERLQGDYPTVKQSGQLQEMPAISALEALSGQQEQIATKPQGSIQDSHSAVVGEPRLYHNPEHISDKQTQEQARSVACVQGIPSTTEEEPQLDRCCSIFSFLQDQLFGRLKESTKNVHPKTSNGLQEDHSLEESSSGQWQQVSAPPNQPEEAIQLVTKVEPHINYRPKNVRGLQEQMPVRPESTTEDISLTIEEKFSGQQELMSAKLKAPVQHVHTVVEEVLHVDRTSQELNTQKEQLSARSLTSMQGMHPVMEDTPDEEELLELEQLSARPQTYIQGMQLVMEDRTCEKESLEPEQFSARPEAFEQGMQPMMEEVPHESYCLENLVSQQVQALVTATTSKQTAPSTTEEAPSADDHPKQPIVQQEYTAAVPERSILGACPGKEKMQQGDCPPGVFDFLQKALQDNWRGLCSGQEQMAAKPEVPGKSSNTVAEEIQRGGSCSDKFHFLQQTSAQSKPVIGV